MTKAILFDFIGVLLFKKGNYKPERLVDEIDSTIGKTINDEKFKRLVIKKYGLNDEEFETTLKKIVSKYEKYQPIWEILPSIKDKYKLGIINNGTTLTLPFFRSRYEIDKYFDVFVCSAEEGIAKPNKKIYLITSKKLNIEPSECLFMDDSYKNIEGAKSIGMKTILWENKEKGLDRFEKFLADKRKI